MQRKGYAAGAVLAAVLAVGAVGCTGASGSGASAADSKPGSVSAEAATAPPGTHRDLPDPCGTVGADVLREMLPGVEERASARKGGGTPAAYEGERAVTYDNDRRVGCRWKSSTDLGSRHLLVDFERVVSYDPAVSDDERAARLYEDMVLDAGIPTEPPSEEGSAEPKASKEAEDAKGAEDAEDAEKASRGDASRSDDPAEAGEESEESEVATPRATPEADLAPRPLKGVGDAAYIDDELVTADSGVHRDITLVFRTGNVIVTVEYEQWVTDKRRLPNSAELQEKALKLARKLVGEFDD